MQRVIGKRLKAGLPSAGNLQLQESGLSRVLSWHNLRCFGPGAGVGSLSKAQVPKERFMNRSEWMANKFKNDPMAYSWVPEVMSTIDPAPQYHNNGYPKKSGMRLTA